MGGGGGLVLSYQSYSARSALEQIQQNVPDFKITPRHIGVTKLLLQRPPHFPLKSTCQVIHLKSIKEITLCFLI